MYRYNLSRNKLALPVTWILIPKSRESTDKDDDDDDLKTRKMGLEYYFRLVCNASTFSQSRLFVYSAMMALTICTSAIVFHVSHHSCAVTLIPFWIKCAEGPHQLCDLIFYRVLPLFDCVYVCGAIFGIIAAKINHHLLYTFFVISACCTLTCYAMNVILDIRVLVGPERTFLNKDGTHIIL